MIHVFKNSQRCNPWKIHSGRRKCCNPWMAERIQVNIKVASFDIEMVITFSTDQISLPLKRFLNIVVFRRDYPLNFLGACRMSSSGSCSCAGSPGLSYWFRLRRQTDWDCSRHGFVHLILDCIGAHWHIAILSSNGRTYRIWRRR